MHVQYIYSICRIYANAHTHLNICSICTCIMVSTSKHIVRKVEIVIAIFAERTRSALVAERRWCAIAKVLHASLARTVCRSVHSRRASLSKNTFNAIIFNASFTQHIARLLSIPTLSLSHISCSCLKPMTQTVAT